MFFLLIIPILLLIILCNFFYKTSKNEDVDKISGEIVKGDGLSSKLGYPTINIELDQPVPCGIYNSDSRLGKGVLFIDYTGRFAELHLDNYKDIIEFGRVELSINKILSKNKKGIIGTYLRGCD